MAQTPWEHPQEYQDETWHSAQTATVRQWVFGMNDGLVATVGLVAGLTFAHSSQGIVLGATTAAILAAIVSMALGSFLATHTTVRYQTAEIEREKREIQECPDEELDEMRRIYLRYGFSAEETAMILYRFEKDHSLWLQMMLRDELGIIPETFENPWHNAGSMALAVLVGSLPPLLPNLLVSLPLQAFPWVIVLSALTAFLLGAVTTRGTSETWWRSGLLFLVIASAAAAIGMGAGQLITPLLGL
ncbi:VIT1/CCC1 transporter family protein [Sulfobacillus sp. hq2]|uniref:VIT1/CCC1 transporter family protein n=1 Tax=Sulfobacillus TaxID=28033 RepID=UPI000CCFFECA|nr:VIT1/CCC1 transporter family protein [Sulfobacillus sp. hq2]POB10543.1 hypothetical protein CO251_09545 [Sulfobacillus sp. hq2]